jgi:preprotein translocase subunit SecG
VSAIFPVFRSEILSIHPHFGGTSHFGPDALKTAPLSGPGSGRLPKKLRNSTMQTLLVVAELIIAVALIFFVLLQRSEGGALGMGGGSSMGGLFTARGAADTLTRTTSVLAVLFFATCIALNLLALHGRNESGASLLDSVPTASAPAKPAPAAPALPIGPSVPKPQ